MSNPETQAQRNESTRKAVLDYLAQRHQLAQTATTIWKRTNAEHGCGLDEVQAALTFLEGLGFVTRHHDPLGSTLYWQATSQGVLAAERG